MDTKSSVENGISEPVANPFNTHKGELITIDDTIELCAAFIRKCQEQSDVPHRLRGPYLAAFVLYKKLLDEGFEDASRFVGK